MNKSIQIPLCDCNKVSKRVISSKGNAYYACASLDRKNKCKFFQWENPPTKEEEEKPTYWNPIVTKRKLEQVDSSILEEIKNQNDIIIDALNEIKNLLKNEQQQIKSLRYQ